jgi:hypothetical protein
VPQVGHYPESHQDARSTKHKIMCKLVATARRRINFFRALWSRTFLSPRNHDGLQTGTLKRHTFHTLVFDAWIIVQLPYRLDKQCVKSTFMSTHFLWDMMSRHYQLLTFRKKMVPSKRREPITQWHGVVYQQDGALNHAALNRHVPESHFCLCPLHIHSYV